MKRLLAVLIVLILMPSLARALPLCPTDQNETYHNCHGTYTDTDGTKYVGEWKDDEYHGHGAIIYPNEDKYVGEFKDDKRHGRGTYTNADGSKYIGEYRNDKRHREVWGLRNEIT